ncbi:restriction endonuclease [Tissierella pigra]|uniref:Restriction endonuclease n=1 Tax=Tissierella pigra TaxID=2607614 RepID=A0A6N7XXK0_9FIRM|nr:restriction endonuclease [Tissierella pigra]MBU5426217.1 restriction endonuclease [Tissierella pigra]MSU01215.1 restriction endonuclease [Tissierella pigra]
MFKNLFKGLSKNNENMRNREKKLVTNAVPKKELQSLITHENNMSMDIENELKQHVDEEIQITKGTLVNDDNLTLEKPAKKTTEKFTEYKLFYRDNFLKCKSINEVLDTYLKYTDSDNIMDEIRLRYVSMYLFNTSLSNDKLEIIDLKSLLTKRLSETDIENELKQQGLDEEIQITKGASVNDDNLTLEKPAQKSTEKLIKYKLFYKDKFVNCKSINDVLDTYLKYTDSNDMMEEIRLRYVSMYLFNTGLSNDKLNIKDLKSLLAKRLSGDRKVDDTVMLDDNNILNGKLYSEIKLHFKDEIHKLHQAGQDANIDRLLISLFLHYEVEAIDSVVFLRSLLRVIKDMDLSKIDTEDNYFGSYLKQRILNIKDTEFWQEDEERFYRCEILIIGRYIMVKTKGFVHIISNLKEGPMYINVTSINNNTLFNLNIDGTVFVTNAWDRDKILNYFNFVNDEILEEVNQKVNTIVKEVENVSLELIAVIENFLNIMPLNILLDRDLYIAFEHLISFNSFVAQQLLDSNSEQRDNIIDKLRGDANFYNNLQSFIDENYKKLVKIAGKYINTAEEYHSSVIWKLIRKSSLQFISEYWKNEYGIYIKDDIQATDLSEYVDAYCRCLDIPTKNIVTVGSFTYYLMGRDMFPTEIERNFVQCNIYLIEKILQKIEELELEIFENRLTNRQVQKSVKYSINDVDLMDGHEFERFVSLLFTKMGYMTEITKGSGDQGMDVIAEKNGSRIGIQAKCYSSKVTNKAVQEIFTSLNYYNCNKGMVITNNYFTESALELAQSNNIVLWDRDILKRKIDEIFN